MNLPSQSEKKINNEVFFVFASSWLLSNIYISTKEERNMSVLLGVSDFGKVVKVGAGSWMKNMLQNSHNFNVLYSVLMRESISEGKTHVMNSPVAIALLNEYIKAGLLAGFNSSMALSKAEVAEILSEINNYMLIDEKTQNSKVAEFPTYDVDALLENIWDNPRLTKKNLCMEVFTVKNITNWLVSNREDFYTVIMEYTYSLKGIMNIQNSCKLFNFEAH